MSKKKSILFYFFIISWSWLIFIAVTNFLEVIPNPLLSLYRHDPNGISIYEPPSDYNYFIQPFDSALKTLLSALITFLCVFIFFKLLSKKHIFPYYLKNVKLFLEFVFVIFTLYSFTFLKNVETPHPNYGVSKDEIVEVVSDPENNKINSGMGYIKVTAYPSIKSVSGTNRLLLWFFSPDNTEYIEAIPIIGALLIMPFSYYESKQKLSSNKPKRFILAKRKKKKKKKDKALLKNWIKNY